MAVESWKLAPQRFSWQRHPQYPNLDTARVALSDAKKAKHGALVEGDNQSGWLLTAAGLSWTRGYTGLDTSATDADTKLRREFSGALKDLRRSSILTAWAGGTRAFDLIAIADAVDLPADAPRQVIIRRVDALLNAAKLANDPETEGFLQWLNQELSS